MTTFLASLLPYLISFPFFIILPEKNAENVMIQAYLRIGHLLKEEKKHLKMFGNLILKDSKEFTKEEIQRHLLKIPEIQYHSDHIALTFFIQKEKLSQGLTLIHSVLNNPHFLKNEERLKNLHHKLVQNFNSFFVIAGNLDPLRVQEAFYTRFYVPYQDPYPMQNQDSLFKKELNSVKESNMLVLSCPAFKMSDSSSSAKFLAILALGVGKGSSLYRVLREEQGLTYFQQAQFSPTMQGLRPYFMIFKSFLPTSQRFIKNMKDDLLKDIQGWTTAHLSRVQGLGRGICCHDLMPELFGLGFSDVCSAQKFNTLKWKGYLSFVGDSFITLSYLAKKFHLVTLTEIQKQAIDLVKNAEELTLDENLMLLQNLDISYKAEENHIQSKEASKKESCFHNLGEASPDQA